jgi:cell division protein FtsB
VPDAPDVVASLRATNAGLRAENAELRAQMAGLAEQVARLERLISRNCLFSELLDNVAVQKPAQPRRRTTSTAGN